MCQDLAVESSVSPSLFDTSTNFFCKYSSSHQLARTTSQLHNQHQNQVQSMFQHNHTPFLAYLRQICAHCTIMSDGDTTPALALPKEFPDEAYQLLVLYEAQRGQGVRVQIVRLQHLDQHCSLPVTGRLKRSCRCSWLQVQGRLGQDQSC